MTLPSLKQPWYRYRPIKVRDGRGGSTETFSDAQRITVFGVMRVHDTYEEIIVEGEADVRIGDAMRLRED